MMGLTTLLVGVVTVMSVVAMPAEMPEPGELALLLSEEEFDDYLDKWIELEQERYGNATSLLQARNGCQLRVNGNLGQPQPVYIHNRNYPVPRGNTGIIHLNTGEAITIACTGSGRAIRHPQISSNNIQTATAQCVSGALVSGPGWLNGNGAFGGLTCDGHAFHIAEFTDQRCFNNFRVIRVGFVVNNVFYPKYFSCFNPNRLEVLYTWATQNPSHAVHQTGVDRPSWLAGSFFPGVNINNLYTQNHQRNSIAQLVGSVELANRYVTSTQFLARGHLVAKSDMIFATGQRSTFYFINAAPQWQPFNAGNWNWLEQNLRARIGAAGYHTTVYTGTWGVTQLRNQAGRLVNIFLNNNQLPVPLYFYKVVYDASRRQGTAFVSINNPHYTLAEVRALTFCTDRCRNNNAFNWLRWQPDRIDIGYSFCCDVNEFRRTIPHLPAFTVNGLLA
ncbi:uncharacterized protein LOC126366063 [Pectinophora gossypiella]|nr:uncharacterized protein LOC126366063 [Pectinophora gossypiella]